MMRALVLAGAAALAACGDDGGGGDGGIDVSPLTYAPCSPERHVGGFDVILAADYTAVQGQVFNAVTPIRVAQTLAASGACRWLRSPILVCDPACPSGQTCDANRQCIAQPVAQDVGTVTVRGMKTAVAMEPRAPAYFYSFPGTLPHPGFDAGAGLRLEAGELALLGWGIEPLAIAATTIAVQSGAPVTVSWAAPAQAGPAKVELTLNVNGHGLVGSRVECVADDTGAFTIEEPMVTSLLGDGLSGFPTLTVRRTTTDSADVAWGCVELDVESAITLDVMIPGLQSCRGDEDCTPPQTCQPDLTCR